VNEVARDLWQLKGFPPNGINVYLAGEVLIDAATKRAEKRVLSQLRPHRVTAHALTHAHPDHQGVSHVACTRLGIPLWCGAADVDAAEDPRLIHERMPPGRLNRLQERYWTGPGHPVDRQLREGDTVGDYTVLDVPGHARGHVAFWRESDRTLIAGDVFNNMNVFTGMPGLHEPARMFTEDPARNRESMRELAALRPAVMVFGHGAPLRDPGKLQDFVDRL
jgi:glyoxylase-like metal-dependent hydrolase (beta-lactamase superfamily II)